MKDKLDSQQTFIHNIKVYKPSKGHRKTIIEDEIKTVPDSYIKHAKINHFIM